MQKREILTKKEKEGLARKMLEWPKERILRLIDKEGPQSTLSLDAMRNLKNEVERVFDGAAEGRERCIRMIIQALF